MGLWINAHLHRELHLTKVLECLRALPAADRRRLGIDAAGRSVTYRQVHSLWSQLMRWFKEEEAARHDLTWFVAGNAVVAASALPGYAASGAAATDGTAIPTWGALHFDERRLNADPDVAAARASAQDDDPPTGKAARPATYRGPVPLSIDAAGKPVYTKDPDARAGHRTATNSHAAGGYCGYELHASVQARSASWHGDPKKVTLGVDVPAICLGYDLVPAGSPRDTAALHLWDAMDVNGFKVTEQVVDRGYSQLKATKFHLPARRRGIRLTMDLKKVQRERTDKYKGAYCEAGMLFHEALPPALRMLPAANRVGQPLDPALEAKYNERAQFRFSIHKRPDTEGVWRARCPFHAGRLKNKGLHPASARRSRKSARSVPAPAGMKQCCDGIITVGADLMPDSFQEIPYGTTAWRHTYGRRQVAESFNASVKNHHGGLGTRGSIRLMGTHQIGFMAAFAIATANVKLIEAFNAARAGGHKIKSKIRRSRRSVPTASSLGVPPPPTQPPP